MYISTIWFVDELTTIKFIEFSNEVGFLLLTKWQNAMLITLNRKTSDGVINPFVVVCIVTFGLGISYMLTRSGNEIELSPSVEGKYRYAAISSDASTCAKVGV